MDKTYHWNDYIYSWDNAKDEINQKKHGIEFREAMTVFDDDNALYKSDPDHSIDEDRFIIIGYSKTQKLLVVCHCYREWDAIIRIFSARKASNEEKKDYGGRL